jgi:DNA-binding transcriptional regulator of glucitol operon
LYQAVGFERASSVLQKKGKEKQNFSRGNFKKKTIHKIIPRKKNVRLVRIKREKERERRGRWWLHLLSV